jgi:hypothetical protein
MPKKIWPGPVLPLPPPPPKFPGVAMEQRQDSQITVPPSERRGGPGTRHFARWKQISR